MTFILLALYIDGQFISGVPFLNHEDCSAALVGAKAAIERVDPTAYVRCVDTDVPTMRPRARPWTNG